MNVSLTPELERLVEEKVQSGMYHTASEVVREALRLLKERDETRSSALADLQEKLAEGLRDLNSGRSTPLSRRTIEEVKKSGRSKLKATGKTRSR